jgi:hypothetical protein
MRRLAIAAALGAVVAGTAVPSLAATGTPTQSIPIGISNDNGKICVWFSEQVPQCVDTRPITDTIPADFSIGPVHVHVSTAGGIFVSTALGTQPLVGVSLANGWLCIGFSEEVPTCYPLNSTNAAVATQS